MILISKDISTLKIAFHMQKSIAFGFAECVGKATSWTLSPICARWTSWISLDLLAASCDGLPYKHLPIAQNAQADITLGRRWLQCAHSAHFMCLSCTRRSRACIKEIARENIKPKQQPTATNITITIGAPSSQSFYSIHIPIVVLAAAAVAHNDVHDQQHIICSYALRLHAALYAPKINTESTTSKKTQSSIGRH